MPEFTASEGESLTTLSVDITVPDSDFEVVACYSVQQQLTDGGHTMLLEENPSVRLYGVSPEKGYRYFDCYLLTADAYTITNVEFSIGGGEWRSLAETTGCSFTRSALVDNVYQVTVRPDYEDVTGDVTLRVVGEQHARHSITWEHAEDTYLDLEQSTLPTESIDGEQVTAELRVKPDYYLASADISAQGVEPELIERIYVRFEMPAEDVTVTLNFMEKIAVSCTASDHVSEATFYDADDIYYGVPTDKGIPGETVYLFATADEGYKPMQARISSGETFAFEHYAYAMSAPPYGFPTRPRSSRPRWRLPKPTPYRATKTSPSTAERSMPRERRSRCPSMCPRDSASPRSRRPTPRAERLQ